MNGFDHISVIEFRRDWDCSRMPMVRSCVILFCWVGLNYSTFMYQGVEREHSTVYNVSWIFITGNNVTKMRNTKKFWDSLPCQLSSFVIQVRNANRYVRNYVTTCGFLWYIGWEDELITAKVRALYVALVTRLTEVQHVWSNDWLGASPTATDCDWTSPKWKRPLLSRRLLRSIARGEDTMACTGHSSSLARWLAAISKIYLVWFGREWLDYSSIFGLFILSLRFCIQKRLEILVPNTIAPLSYVFIYCLKGCYFFVDVFKFCKRPQTHW